MATDLAIAMLKSMLIRNATNVNCPFVVIMSATFDPKGFIDYFNVPLLTNHISVKGINYRITDIYLERATKNYIIDAMAIIRDICYRPNEEKRCDILVFLPSIEYFNLLMLSLNSLNEELAIDGKNVFSPIMVNRAAVQEQNRDFIRTTSELNYNISIGGKDYIPTRRIVLSNTVAETGLTLDNLKYVIDSGWYFGSIYNPALRVGGILMSAAPQSRIKQRRGRVGRNFPGECYYLYSRKIHKTCEVQQKPAIQIENVSAVFIDLIKEQYKTKVAAGNSDPEFLLSDLDLIDDITPDMALNLVELFTALGFLSCQAPRYRATLQEMIADPDYPREKSRHGLTLLGAMYASFTNETMTPECARMILAAYSWGVSVLDMITIAAFLCMEMPLFTPANTSKPVDMQVIYKAGLPGFLTGSDMNLRIKSIIGCELIDGLIVHHAITSVVHGKDPYQALVTLRNWCADVNLKYHNVLDLCATRDKFIEQMLASEFNVFKDGGVRIWGCSPDTLMDVLCRFKHCIYDGFRCNLLTRDKHGEYYTTHGLKVVTPDLFKNLGKKITDAGYEEILKIEPTYVVYHRLEIRENRKTRDYEIRVGKFSIMDGFVSVDVNFLS
jgi:HrpA-like RNA helicase